MRRFLPLVDVFDLYLRQFHIIVSFVGLSVPSVRPSVRSFSPSVCRFLLFAYSSVSTLFLFPPSVLYDRIFLCPSVSCFVHLLRSSVFSVRRYRPLLFILLLVSTLFLRLSSVYSARRCLQFIYPSVFVSSISMYHGQSQSSVRKFPATRRFHPLLGLLCIPWFVMFPAYVFAAFFCSPVSSICIRSIYS